jgi:drug/metabolite transporter (DMT)-like permease
MVATWLQITILTAAIYAFISLFDKLISDIVLPDPVAAMALNGLPRFLTFMIIGAIGGNLFLGSVDGIWARRWLVWAGIGTGVLYAFAMIVWYRGIATTDVTTFVPLFSTRTIFTTALAALFLSETFPSAVYIGIVMIVLGAIVISVEDPAEEITRLALESRDAVLLSLITAAMFAIIYIALDGLTIGADIWSILFWIGFGGAVISMDFAVIKRTELLELGSRSKVALAANGGLSAVAFFTFTAAISLGPVSLVVAIVNLDAVFVFLGAMLLSQLMPGRITEETDPASLVQKGAATALIIGGGVIINLFS